MTTRPPGSADTEAILAELRILRDEMAELRQDTRAALAALRELFSEISRVEATEGTIEQELEEVSDRLGDALDGRQPSLTSCEVCGSALEHHPARNGILLICKACGHTAFANRRLRPERRSGRERRDRYTVAEDGPPAETPEIIDWTADR